MGTIERERERERMRIELITQGTRRRLNKHLMCIEENDEEGGSGEGTWRVRLAPISNHSKPIAE